MEYRTCSRAEADHDVAVEIAALLEARAREGATLVLGLATGRSPLGVYRELVALHRMRALPVHALRTFNLDEYLGLAPRDPRSFLAQMRRELFDPLELTPSQWAIPRGDLPEHLWEAHAAEYRDALRAADGIDLQLLGLGRNGHIGFNEPGSPREARVRVVELAASTREDAAEVFGALGAVPVRAISLGVADILEARRIRLLAFGAHKHAALRAALSGPPTVECPLSWLQPHSDFRIYTDCPDAQLGVRR